MALFYWRSCENIELLAKIWRKHDFFCIEMSSSTRTFLTVFEHKWSKMSAMVIMITQFDIYLDVHEQMRATQKIAIFPIINTIILLCKLFVVRGCIV